MVENNDQLKGDFFSFPSYNCCCISTAESSEKGTFLNVKSRINLQELNSMACLLGRNLR